MPFETSDRQHLTATYGYIELGMFEEANAELEKIDPFCRAAPEVLGARVNIYRALQRWEAMATIAARLVEWNPDEPSYFVDLAYATRRAESLQKAYAILIRGENLHPFDAAIQFNLACYETQLGSLESARRHLNIAETIQPRFKLLALEDPDLQPLWAN